MLSARPLKRCQIARMYPVLLQVLPTLTLKDWTAFATAMIRRRNADRRVGVIAIETDSNIIRGGFIYEVEASAAQGRRLIIRHVVIPVLGQGIVADAVHAAVEQIARSYACAAIAVELPSDATWEAAYFAGLGHAVREVGHSPALSGALR
jgi:hypothetical protein